jgi:hypothetical protein
VNKRTNGLSCLRLWTIICLFCRQGREDTQMTNCGTSRSNIVISTRNVLWHSSFMIPNAVTSWLSQAIGDRQGPGTDPDCSTGYLHRLPKMPFWAAYDKRCLFQCQPTRVVTNLHELKRGHIPNNQNTSFNNLINIRRNRETDFSGDVFAIWLIFALLSGILKVLGSKAQRQDNQRQGLLSKSYALLALQGTV